MEIFAGLSVLILLVAALAIAIKTFAVWRRTRGIPEFLLGMYLSCATVMGYPLAIAMTRIPASENWVIHVLAEVVMSVGWACLLFFTLRVFRPNALWAACLVGLLLFLGVAGAGSYVAEVIGGKARAPEDMTGLVVFISFPIAIAYFWTTFESLGYYRRLKLRLRLGLVEAVVVNRMMLWGLMTLAAGVALVFNMAALLAGSYMSAPIVLLSSVLGLAHATCLFLAFNPPRWYAGWLERRAPAAAV